ncbi:MAG: membrane protein insertase YidC [Acidobacteriia bacterium]|nr:membrane protein insertase YidC [Terriglobia bacterium]
MPEAPPKEMSMELRLLLAFLLMGAVMFLTPYLVKSPPAPVKKGPETAASLPAKAPAASGAAAAPAAGAPAASTAPSVPATSQQALPPLIIDNGVFRISFSNRGATVRGWQLSGYKGNDNNPLQLVNTAANVDFPFSLYFPAEKPATNLNQAYFKQTPDPDGLGVLYEFSDGHTDARKTFRFQRNSYRAQVTSEVTVDGRPVASMLQWRGGFGDLTVANPASHDVTAYFNVPEDKLVEQRANAAKNGPVTATGAYSFAGIVDQYFAAVFLPEDNRPVTVVTFSDSVPTAFDQKPEPFAGAAVSGGTANRFSVFVGPKDVDLLGRINPKLTDLVNFGWMAVIAKPLFLILRWTHSVVHNFGWAIVVVTIFLNVLMLPLRMTSMKSARKMQALKPQLDAIAAKYKDISLRDPRKQQQQQEQMELYKKYGINPMGGCLPSLLPLALIWPFYRVITAAAEMRGAHWLWVTDLSQPEHLAIKILPIAMIVTQFLMQKMMPAPGVDPNQQKMMLFMPLIFGYMFYNLPSGLVLYYLTGTVVAIGQQWFFNHTDAAQAAARSVQPPPKKRNGRK